MFFAVVSFVLALSPPQVSAGQAFLNASAAKLKAVQSISLEVNSSSAGAVKKMQVKILRGGYFRATSPESEAIISPAAGWLVNFDKKQFVKPDGKKSDTQVSSLLPGFEPLFAGANSLEALSAPEVRKTTDKSVVRIKVKFLRFGIGPTGGEQYISFDQETKLPVAVEASEGGHSSTMTYEHIKLDPGLTPRDFQWSPPTGWTKIDLGYQHDEPAQEAPGQDSFHPPDFSANVLKINTAAPEFVLNNAMGGKTSFAVELKGKKAMLVNFWYYGCQHCQEELPHLRDLYGRLKKQGFGIISVNREDDSKTIKDYAKRSKLPFPIVMNGKGGPDVVKMYHVEGFPTNYLVDSNGKIIATFVGFDENAMKKALEKAGFKL